MNCTDCTSQTKKHGKDRYGNQRFRCLTCGKTFIKPKTKTLGTMTLAEDKALMCLNLLVEGNSIRSIERITGVHRDTVLSLLETVGKKCLAIQETFVKDVKVKFVQADEIWSYINMKDKAKHAKELESDRIGSAYTFTAIDSDSKLIVAWHLGHRTERDALIFLEKFYQAIDGGTKQFQMTTDAWPGYNHTVNEVLGMKAHYAQLVKQYAAPNPNEVRYSPAECTGAKKRVMFGNPMKSKISTSHVERANLTMRMSMRRFTRLTNGFSKKWENHEYAIALHFAHYNFCRSHKTLSGATPAMAANLTKTIWSLKDLLNVAVNF
ncbi:MAG: IS1 family transposase [Pyrinomonadaceae bacterium]